MRPFFLIFFLTTSTLFASIHAEYKITYEYAGEIGHGVFDVNITEDTYRIVISGKPLGVAKWLSNNHRERVTSRGSVKNGRLIPQTYEKIMIESDRREEWLYRFDHAKKQITLEKKKIKEGKTKRYKRLFDYYTEDDLLTLFFNVHLDKNGSKAKLLNASALGADPKNGAISVNFLEGFALNEAQSLLKTKEGEFISVRFKQPFFIGSRGNLRINLDKDHIPIKVLLKDAIFFGDLNAKRVK